MEGRFPIGIRCAYSECTDSSQLADFNEWYDRVHLPDMLASALVKAAVRYERAEDAESQPRFLAIYELDRPDLERAGEEITAYARRLHERGRMHPAMRIEGRQMWRRVGGEFRAEKPPGGLPRGVFLVESNCNAPDREEEFNRWLTRRTWATCSRRASFQRPIASKPRDAPRVGNTSPYMRR
jgi:hypothetical protein